MSSQTAKSKKPNKINELDICCNCIKIIREEAKKWVIFYEKELIDLSIKNPHKAKPNIYERERIAGEIMSFLNFFDIDFDELKTKDYEGRNNG